MLCHGLLDIFIYPGSNSQQIFEFRIRIYARKIKSCIKMPRKCSIKIAKVNIIQKGICINIQYTPLPKINQNGKNGCALLRHIPNIDQKMQLI